MVKKCKGADTDAAPLHFFTLALFHLAPFR